MIKNTDFITKWRLGARSKLVLPVEGTFRVDWGDGTVERFVDRKHNPSHTYKEDGPFLGLYIVSVSDTGVWHDRTTFNGLSIADKIEDVMQWGGTEWVTFRNFFSGAKNMQISALDAPNLLRVQDLSYMFSGCYRLNARFDHWDVSSVVDMSHMFFNCVKFNQRLNGWDVSSVVDMSDMFSGARDFDQSLNDWDTGSVRDTSHMFLNAVHFNGDVSSWDVCGVLTMQEMFCGARLFNQSLENWDVSHVRAAQMMFAKARAFNQDLISWKLPVDTDTSEMFDNKGSLETYLEPFKAKQDQSIVSAILEPKCDNS